MKRFAPVLLVLSGWFIAQIAGTPQQVYAQARTSLSSLQAAIDNIINGNTTVGHADNADHAAFSDDAGTLGGVAPAGFVTEAELDNDLATITGDVDSLGAGLVSLDARVSDVESSAVFQGQSVRIGPDSSTSNASNYGTIRFNGVNLEVSTPAGWRALSFAN